MSSFAFANEDILFSILKNSTEFRSERTILPLEIRQSSFYVGGSDDFVELL